MNYSNQFYLCEIDRLVITGKAEETRRVFGGDQEI
jgi:hypothetical protein